MEPERPIEKLLRAYARKRRAEARAAFQLHPATRRLLQGEVARRRPAEGGEDSSLSLWELLRANWAALLGFTLIIFFCASLFVPALGKAKMKAKSVAAVSHLKQIGVAAQIAAVDNGGKLPATLDALTNQLGSDQPLTDPVSGKRFIYVANGAVLDDLPSNEVLAYSPEDKKGRAVLFADGSVQRLRHDEFSALTNRSPLLLAVAENTARARVNEMPTATPAAAPPAGGLTSSLTTTAGFELASSSQAVWAGGLGDSSGRAAAKPQAPTDSRLHGLSQSQRFVQAAMGSNPPVLASFAVELAGNQISVVDRDGSIYQGTLQPIEPARGDFSRTETDAEKPVTGSETTKVALGWESDSLVASQQFSFRATGASRSLKQSVVLAGNLVVPANNNTALYFDSNRAGRGGGGGGEKSKITTAALDWVITGTVTLDSTNQFELHAVPQAR